jgi:hypothetical protein
MVTARLMETMAPYHLGHHLGLLLHHQTTMEMEMAMVMATMMEMTVKRAKSGERRGIISN